MSRLRVYWPQTEAVGTAVAEPDVLPFRRADEEDVPDVISRARLLFNNRCCPECGYAVVKPLELDDSAINRNGLTIPGTATLIGFCCQGCKSSWSV